MMLRLDLPYERTFVKLEKLNYQHGSLALVAKCGETIIEHDLYENQPYATISVNVAGIHLDDDEFIVSHNTDSRLIKELITQGICTDTKRRVSYGFVVGTPVLKLTPKAIETLSGVH